MTLSRRQRHEQHYAVRDWHLEAPHNPAERVTWLRAEAAALLNEALDIEHSQPHPPQHQPCQPCEECLLEIITDAKRMNY